MDEIIVLLICGAVIAAIATHLPQILTKIYGIDVCHRF